jgi:hypothetical protein
MGKEIEWLQIGMDSRTWICRVKRSETTVFEAEVGAVGKEGEHWGRSEVVVFAGEIINCGVRYY